MQAGWKKRQISATPSTLVSFSDVSSSFERVRPFAGALAVATSGRA
jgi:hypothetical protein